MYNSKIALKKTYLPCKLKNMVECPYNNLTNNKHRIALKMEDTSIVFDLYHGIVTYIGYITSGIRVLKMNSYIGITSLNGN